MDIEALLQELVIDVTVPDGAFIMGDDSGYYAWDSGSSEYRVSAYASGEALDEAALNSPFSVSKTRHESPRIHSSTSPHKLQYLGRRSQPYLAMK
jgi:hypothetical protein